MHLVEADSPTDAGSREARKMGPIRCKCDHWKSNIETTESVFAYFHCTAECLAGKTVNIPHTMLDSSTLPSRHSPRPGSQRRDPWEYKDVLCREVRWRYFQPNGMLHIRIQRCHATIFCDVRGAGAAPTSRCAEVHGCKGGRAPGVRRRAAEKLLLSARRDSLKFSVIMRTRRDTNERLHRNTMTAEMRPAIIG